MPIRKEVWDFLGLGRLPTTEPLPPEVTPEVIARYQAALGRVPRPIADDEVAVLMTGFGPDDCFGLAWSLMDLIETAPAARAGTLLVERPRPWANQWVRRLWARTQAA